jgi:hypothetical protein
VNVDIPQLVDVVNENALLIRDLIAKEIGCVDENGSSKPDDRLSALAGTNWCVNASVISY